ncbi:DUF4190 domain-containing protein [Nocardia uniformis]|uniref:DUF4190 domain-containing protein n=1 Tax=Nocardia uniformis TaxID=53432 RepID=A0A849CFJ8_9NOCA|nr:DUF4190 domain-containing protein [Nocardia uniformis]NNH75495.1 DUF4190 domain-containing protein [Nocardia uniformis]
MSYQTPPPGYPAYPPVDHPQAVLILVLGILSLVFCQLAGPVAWVMGRNALREIDSSGGAMGGRGMVMAGYVCGIIASIFIILAVIVLILAIVFGVFVTTSSA